MLAISHLEKAGRDLLLAVLALRGSVGTLASCVGREFIFGEAHSTAKTAAHANIGTFLKMILLKRKGEGVTGRLLIIISTSKNAYNHDHERQM